LCFEFYLSHSMVSTLSEFQTHTTTPKGVAEAH